MSDNNAKTAPSKALIIFSVVAVVLLLVCAFIGVAAANTAFTPETAPKEGAITDYVAIVDSVYEKNADHMSELRSMTDLQDLITLWAASNNDAKMYLSGATTYLVVVNEAGAVDTNYGNADIIALVSVNKNNKSVNIAALDRDMYVYADLADSGLNGYAKQIFTKLNAVYANGGAELLKKTLEYNFKVRIDHYLVTDMAGVAAVSTALGGVNVPVSEDLSMMLEEDFGVALAASTQPLAGDDLTAYLREKRDGTASRNARQLEAFKAAVAAAQKAGFGDAFGLLKQISSVCKSDLKGMDLFESLRSTLFGGWSEYTLNTKEMPDDGTAVFYKDSDWVRIADIPTLAKELQILLFGRTNISLHENRLSAVDLISAVNKIYEQTVEKIDPIVDENTEDIPVEDEGTDPVDVPATEESTTKKDTGAVG